MKTCASDGASPWGWAGMVKFTEQMLLDERRNIEADFSKLSKDELLQVAIEAKIAALARFRRLESIRDILEDPMY